MHDQSKLKATSVTSQLRCVIIISKQLKARNSTVCCCILRYVMHAGKRTGTGSGQWDSLEGLVSVVWELWQYPGNAHLTVGHLVIIGKWHWHVTRL